MTEEQLQTANQIYDDIWRMQDHLQDILYLKNNQRNEDGTPNEPIKLSLESRVGKLELKDAYFSLDAFLDAYISQLELELSKYRKTFEEL